MAEHPTHNTKYGTFGFSVRLSIADGQVVWAVWSSEDDGANQSCGYTFSGPAIDHAIQGEDHADGGELIATNAVYDALLAVRPASIIGEALIGAAEGYMRIDQVTDALPALCPSSSEEATPLANARKFYPTSLLTMATQGEFRSVYTLFINVQTLPDPGTENDFLPLLFQLLKQYGGYLCRIGRIGASDPGGTFLLFWGAPTSHENDLNRALSFLLALHAQVDVPLRAGITHAVVYAGFVGSTLREEYTCYGSSVNQAARQMTMAEWGQMLLDAETARRAQEDFEVTLVGNFLLKGFADEQPLFTLLGHQERSKNIAPAAGLVGREPELAQLQAAVEPIFEGRFAGLTLISGEAGIGKSRLVHEFGQRIRERIKRIDTDSLQESAPTSAQSAPQHPLSVFLCQTDEILRESLNPFRYFLRRYFEQSPGAEEAINKASFAAKLDTLVATTSDGSICDELARTRSFLGALVNLRWTDSLYEQLEPQLRFENTVAALKTLILAESLRQPLLLMIEDLQWLDEDSRSMLAQLTRSVADFPFAILATTRPTDEKSALPTDLIAHEINLSSLSSTDLASLAQGYLGAPASPELSTLLMERADGNPFYAEQILLYLLEQRVLVDTGAGWQLADVVARAATGPNNVLPTDLQMVLVARLDRLAHEVKQVVQTAAVLGREFSVLILSQILRDEVAVEEKVQSAVGSAVWHSLSELRYLFRHALLRDAAYDMQLRARLRGLHKAAAEAIEVLFQSDLAPYYADLAYHYHHADMAEKEHHFARLAGEQAAANFANRAAITYFERALALTPERAIDLRFDLLMACNSVYALIGEPVIQLENLVLLTDLSNLMAEPARQAEVSLAYAEYYIAIGDYTAAGEAAQRTIKLAELAGDLGLQSAGFQKGGAALWHQSKLRDSLVMAEEALRLSRAGGLRTLEAEALITAGIAYWYLGNYPMAQQKIEESLPIYAEIGDPFARQSAVSYLAVLAQISGNDRVALNYFQ